MESLSIYKFGEYYIQQLLLRECLLTENIRHMKHIPHHHLKEVYEEAFKISFEDMKI